MGDNADALPNDPLETADFDSDGVGDNRDDDDDNDGIADINDSDLVIVDSDGDGFLDTVDVFPNDANESVDTDGDGMGDNADTDRDGDGIPNVQDTSPNDPLISGDLDGDGIDDLIDNDIDGDGIENDLDNDADGDGSIDESAQNIAPIAVSDVFNVDNVAQIGLDVLANDTDANGDSITIVSASTRVGEVQFDEGQLLYTPPRNFAGTALIQYGISDGNNGSGFTNVLVNIDTLEDTAVPPLVLPPEDVLVNATGLFTKVDLGVATATDRFGNPLPVSLVDGVTFFKPGVNTAYWETIDEDGNRSVSSQQVLVRPLVSFGKDQTVIEGNDVRISVVLNGPSPEYPISIEYTVAGSASSEDHTLRRGSVEFTQGNVAFINFNTLSDNEIDDNENIVVRFVGEVNAVTNAQHVVTIEETPSAPTFTFESRQSGAKRSIIARDEATVMVKAIIENINVEDSYTYTWESDVGVIDSDNIPSQFSFEPAGITANMMRVTLTITDKNGLSQQQSIELNVTDTLAALSTQQDTDGDNIPDALEGYVDSDGDGLLDFQDSIAESNVIPSIPGDESRFLLESEPGTQLRLGEVAIETQLGAAGLGMSEVADDEFFANVGGLFEFVIGNIPDNGQSVSTVLPQQRPIPEGAIYRKYNMITGTWRDFVIDDNNTLMSAPGEPGYCPPPGADAWEMGLVVGYWCLQTTIEDGGPNDDDGRANGTVVDPGGISVSTVNNALPVLVNDSATMLFNTSATIPVLANDTDPDGDLLTIVSATSDFGEVEIVGDNLIFTPLANYFGDVSITYVVNDGFDVDSFAQVSVNIIVNNAPEAVNDSASTDDKTAIDIDVLSNDTDIDGDALTIVDTTLETVGSGVVTIVNNSIRFTPAAGFDGVAVITYTIADKHDERSSAQLSIDVDGYEQIIVTNEQSSSGGTTSFISGAFLMLLVLLRRAWLVLGVSVIVFTPVALAKPEKDSANEQVASDAKNTGFFITAGAARHRHDISNNDLSNYFDSVDIGLLQYDDTNSEGYQLGLNYVFDSGVMAFGGYRNSGEFNNAWSVNTLDTQQSVQDIQMAMPTIGHGVYYGLGYRYALTSKLFIQAGAEIFNWQQDVTTRSSNGQSFRVIRDGNDMSVSVGAGWRVTDNTNVYLDYRTTKFDDDNVSSIGLNVEYQFPWFNKADKTNPEYRMPVLTDSAEADSNSQSKGLNEQLDVDVARYKQEEAQQFEPRQDTDLTQEVAEIDAVQDTEVVTLATKNEHTEVLELKPSSMVFEQVIYFAPDSTHLNANDKQLIDSMMANYEKGNTITVTGSADGYVVGETRLFEQYNQTLAKTRAEVTASYLVEKGVPFEQITIKAVTVDNVDKFARKGTISFTN